MREALVRDLDPSIRVYDRRFHPDASGHEGRERFLRFSETDSEAFEEVIYGRGKSSALGIEEALEAMGAPK